MNGSPLFVTSATIKDNKIALIVDVGAFDPNGAVEISGHATQSGGAFANFYDIQHVPATPTPDGHAYVEVTADPLPPRPFRKDQDVTVVLRVAKVSVTVLGESTQGSQLAQYQDQTAAEGTTWNQVREVSEINGDSWSSEDSY